MENTIHDDFFKNFTVATSTMSAIEEIPEMAGIYAFYHAFDFSSENLVSDIDKRIQRTVFRTKFIEKDQKSKFIIDTRGEPAQLAGKVRNFVNQLSLPKDRRMLKGLLLSCSLLQRPSYIGTATNLRERFIDHLDREDGFFSKYSSVNLQDEYLFVCFPCQRDVARELESLLIQLCQPIHNSQRS
jgi:hypothetical protein